MSQISEPILIGSFSEAQNAQLVKEKQITAFICLHEGSSYPPGHAILSRMPWFHFNPIEDKTFAWIQKALSKCIKDIGGSVFKNKAIQEGDIIFRTIQIDI